MKLINTLSNKIGHVKLHWKSRASSSQCLRGINYLNYSSRNFETVTNKQNHTYHLNSKHGSSPVPIPLSFEKFQPSHCQDQMSCNVNDSPIIILHGLFGSKQNWRSLAKKLSQLSNKTVFTLDLRNHGESNSTPGFTSYLDYAIDVKNFIDQNKLNQVILMGHSMGGKVAMTLALENCNQKSTSSSLNQKENNQNLIEKLIVIDISPGKGAISERFLDYLKAFKVINSTLISSRKEADEILSQFEQDPSIKQFLLTNLKQIEKTTDDNNKIKNEYKIRLPIEVLEEQIKNNQIGDFPFEMNDHKNITKPFLNSSLFIKGNKSKYINKYNFPIIQHFFKNLKFITLDTGHWVHAEKPNEFLQVVVNFIKED